MKLAKTPLAGAVTPNARITVQRRSIEEDDGSLEAERVGEYAGTAHQSRVGARQEVERRPEAGDPRHRTGEPFVTMP
jgi:hypothetical protein